MVEKKQCGGGKWRWWHLVEWEVPHSHVVDKNWKEYLGSEQSQPQVRPHNPGRVPEPRKYSPTISACKKPVVGTMEETPVSQESIFKGLS